MSSMTNLCHPGVRIRAEVIPKGMSVTEAAKLLGVGRPALSNLLNGNAALSVDMAARLERAFKFPREKLMEMEAQFEAKLAREKAPPTGTKAYVPPFLAIKANDIERWADHNIQARSRLSVFLRRLVNSTGSGLSRVDFPGNDDAERPGWDGFVVAAEDTPWVPAGMSGWEFGTNENITDKANADFKKAGSGMSEEQKASVTFVFVTPRRWPGKSTWVQKKQSMRIWKAVRAYDSSDLEQWLEQSIPAQTWLAGEMKGDLQNTRSLDKCWDDWAGVASPPLPGALFDSAIAACKAKMQSALSSANAQQPFIVAADSTDEALAFVAQALSEKGGPELAEFRDKAVVVDAPGVLPRLMAGALSFVPVIYTRDVEREFASHISSARGIVIYPRNATNIEPDIVLEPASYETFSKALEEAGKSRDEITRLENASGRSLTVLRRQLAILPAVQSPAWSTDSVTAAALVPFMLVGAWNSENDSDTSGLSLLAGDVRYEALERDCQRFVQLNDAPLWSLGRFRGVVSKLDLLFAISGSVTARDLKRFFDVARIVLGEDDPALDLPEDQRWAASIYNKSREFSNAFRQGVSETLVLLSVHGGKLFFSRLGIDPASEAARVVRELLPTPLTTRHLEAHDRDLPTYAEAAPDEFLSIIERDLRLPEPAVLGLLKPVNSSSFGASPSRTGLLWALENLSWSPDTLPRAVVILGRLAQVKITDNWLNKPSNTLDAIFRAWMPQTSADHEMRVALVKKLIELFPDVAWDICLAQFSLHSRVGHYSHKPQWRSDGYGFGEPIRSRDLVNKFVREMVELALTWKSYSREKLSNLVDHMGALAPSDQDRVWAHIAAWATSASEADKALLREKIRVSVLSQRAARRAKRHGTPFGLSPAAEVGYGALETTDPISKYSWLFKNAWVEESADELEDIKEMDFEKRDARIQSLRNDAVQSVHAELGATGLIALARTGQAPWLVGISAERVLLRDDFLAFVRLALQSALSSTGDAQPERHLVMGALSSVVDANRREDVIRSIASGYSEIVVAQILTMAPYRKSTWSIVDTLGQAAQEYYWTNVRADWIHNSDSENGESVERLLKFNRPRAAFSCVRFHPSKVDAELLHQVLTLIARDGGEQSEGYRLDQHHVLEAFQHLDKSIALTLDQKAVLEYA